MGDPNHMQKSVRKQIEIERRKPESDITSPVVDDEWRNNFEKFHARMQDKAKEDKNVEINGAHGKLKNVAKNTESR